MLKHSPQSALASLTEAFRPAREVLPALLWFLVSLSAAVSSSELINCRALAIATSLWGIVRLYEALRCLARRARLAGVAPRLRTIKELQGAFRHARTHGAVYFGTGFRWTPMYTQSAYELERADVKALVPARCLLTLLTHRKPLPADAIGAGWIHGLAAREHPIEVPLKTLEGGTLILGTTQSGKGVLLTLLMSQAIERGEAVIVIDPKGSPRLLAALDRAARAARVAPALRFHPGSHLGVRLDPLANFSRVSELASRVTAGLNETGPFAAFAWRAVYVASNLLIAAGLRPTLPAIKSIVITGPEAVYTTLGQRHYGDALFEAALAENRGNAAKAFRALAATRAEVLPEAFLEAEAFFTRAPEHQAKITAGLLPLLSSLTAGELEASLGGEDASDARPLVRLDRLVEQSSILYVATDALPDAFSASAIATLLISDLASVAAKRYNSRSPARPVNLFIDEASNVMSPALIELLNKGAEAGVHTTCAMQTMSDLEARLGVAAARMALGNFNTLVALRTKDLETARFATETFGKTAVGTLEASRTSASQGEFDTAFSANFTRRLAVRREDRVSVELLGQLPNTEFFASIAGGRIVKGRVPILVGGKP